MIYEEVLAALRLEYAAEHNALPPSDAIYWQYVAEKVFTAFHDAHDDMCFDWLHSVVDKHKDVLLASHPDWATDEYNLLYQE